MSLPACPSFRPDDRSTRLSSFFTQHPRIASSSHIRSIIGRSGDRWQARRTNDHFQRTKDELSERRQTERAALAAQRAADLGIVHDRSFAGIGLSFRAACLREGRFYTEGIRNVRHEAERPLDTRKADRLWMTPTKTITRRPFQRSTTATRQSTTRGRPRKSLKMKLRCRIGRVGRMVSFWARHPPETRTPSVTTALCNLAPLVIRHFQTSGRSRTHTSPHQSSTIKDTL